MLLTLAAAGATLLVSLTLVSVPAVRACSGDARGLVACLRGLIDDRFDLGPGAGGVPVATPDVVEPQAKQIVVHTPVPKVSAAPVAVAETPAVVEAPADPPATPATLVEAKPVEPAAKREVAAWFKWPPEKDASDGAAAPPVAAEEPAEPDAPPEPIALAKLIEPDPAPEVEAPSFVPPAPEIEVDGVPPDLVAAASPEPVRPAAPAPSFVLPSTPELPTTPPPDLTVAAVDPAVPAQEPKAGVLSLAPSVDAVEIEGGGNFIAGNGPAGANMRLYVDGIPVGVSPVEGGRWLVEGEDLLAEGRQTLRVEALDPITGKLLGEASVEFERPAAEPVAEPPALIEAAPDVAIEPEPLPPVQPVVPRGESESVTILNAPDAGSITTLPTGKPPESSVITLSAMPRKSPAVLARFTLPATADVTVLHAVGIGDPGAGRFVTGKAIIRRGDTLWDIAHRYYGRGVHYRTIFRANRELLGRPSRIYPGQVLELPLVYDD